jgi:hypothetical protein
MSWRSCGLLELWLMISRGNIILLWERLWWKLACPYCMENNKVFTLTNGGKASFFYCHRRFLPPNHRYRKNWKNFFVGRVEKDVAPPRLSGEELHDVVSENGGIMFGLQSGKQKFPGFGLTHNWVKQSIFWELLYWRTNLHRHNLDVMHIEKNMFENMSTPSWMWRGRQRTTSRLHWI